MTRDPDAFLSFVKFVMEKIPLEQRRDMLAQNSDKGTVLHIVAAKRFDNDKVGLEHKYTLFMAKG